MTKIIGFLITKENKQPKIDFFDVGLRTICIKQSEYNIYLWGTGDIEKYKINEKYSLSFPIQDNLLDRNILISFENGAIIVENDWLGSIPIFYNTKENIVSTLSNLCLKDKTIHNEGLSNFCEFGYSVFEQTMFKDVKFMRYFSKLTVSTDNFKVEYKQDPVLDNEFIATKTSEEDVLKLMQEYVSNIEKFTDGDIVLPTSGGYDSRILNYLVKDKKRVRSFTYGISKDQSKSTEVVHAKKISEIYNTKWEQIKLKKFHNYINEWYSMYGISTHTHGMYHIEFYKKILENNKFNNPSFLSGIFGDIWAGSIDYKGISTISDMVNLGYTHGINLDLNFLNFKAGNKIKKQFFIENKEYLKNDKIKAVFTIRMKLILISYLTQVPEYFAMPSWTPFLNFEIVKNTLNIDEKRRKNRIWQADFFRKVNLNLEDMNLISTKSNKLDYAIAQHAQFDHIDIELMKEYFDEKRIKEINNILANLSPFNKVINQLLYVRKVGGLLRKIGFKNEYMKALNEYYVLKAMEKGLKDES
jgi:hypothetical protein